MLNFWPRLRRRGYDVGAFFGVPEVHALTSAIRYLLDPGLWVREVLGHTPWEKQVQILESIRDHKVTAVKSCHAAGKSFVAADASLWFLYNHPQSIVITTAPTDRQVAGILWKEIRAGFQRAKVPLPGECLMQELKISNDWFAMGFTSPEHAGDKFQGFHAPFILVVADESSGVSEDIFDAIDGVLTSDESRLLMIGNPLNPSGRFYKEFSSNSHASKITISAYDTPNFTRFGITEQDIISGTWGTKVTGSLPAPYLVSPGWVSDRVKQWGTDSPLYHSKVLAQFPSSGDNTLIPLHWIEAAVDRNLDATEPVELGVDVARFGGDETVIMLRQGSAARIWKVLPMSDTMTTAGEIIFAMRETGSTIAKIDSVGVGAGVFDRLNEQKISVVEMQSGSAAQNKERYGNARAEWWFALRSRFESGDITIPDDEALVTQLAGIRYKVNSRGQILIESKDDMKRRGLSSPDRADALMLTFGVNNADRNAMFSPGLVDRNSQQESWFSFTYSDKYQGALGTSRRRDVLWFCIGHMEGDSVIIDLVRYWLPEDNQLNWKKALYDINLLCEGYRVQTLVHDEHATGIVRQRFALDFGLKETPYTPEHKMQIYENLEERMREGQIKYPADERLLAEMKALQKRWTGDKFTFSHPGSGLVTNSEGPDMIANLAYKIYSSYLKTRDLDDYWRHSEWDDDFSEDRNALTFILPGQAH